jgi:hypothetical protein
VKIPNATSAVIAEDKLCQYLLNPLHRRGASKAAVLLGMGYSAEHWQRLESDLRDQHLTVDIDAEADSEYGKRYEVFALLTGPNGRAMRFRSIWQVDRGTDFPRLITMYVEKNA